MFIVSGVELLETPEALQQAKYSFKSDSLGIGVVAADGHKCDRCWNYSTYVGQSTEHPLLCDRCVAALVGEF